MWFVFSASSVAAFRFTLVPGKVKCFTYDALEAGRYEMRYRMTTSLSPFVSVSVTSASGRALVEHQPAIPDAKEIFELKSIGVIAICFNPSAKAERATSLNVTLDVVDAEDAELTRVKKQSYSTSSPIALGVGKGSGALRQMRYINDALTKIRLYMVTLAQYDKDIEISIHIVEKWAWKLLAGFATVGLVLLSISYLRMWRFLCKMNMIKKKQR
ncbi:unnamed protein product [Phytomonas sp. EM1]|nr:unnamed protein product [Phytomonas sp. EM1]|eukprot:CCW62524.1 unnamed protein product [Phytomonas sp. isolate EM1]